MSETIYLINCLRVPLEPELRAKWIQQISKHQEFDSIPVIYTVCADHFDPDHIEKNKKRQLLKKGALPIYFPE